jgi:predicted PurR-regulated permease PerM
MENRPDYKINRYIFLAIILLFAIMLLMSMMEFFTAFLGAVIFYVLSKPTMYYLTRKRGWKKSSASTLVIIISFFIILLPLLFVAKMLYEEANMIASNPQTIIQPLKDLDNNINQRFHISLLSGDSMAKIQAFATSTVSMLLNTGLNFFSSITMMYFFLYFLLMNTNRLEASIVFYLPFKRSMIEIFGKELVAQTFSNAVAIPLISLIHGLLAFAAYSITGLNQAGFWAVMTGFASIIPIVGTGLIWVPAAIYMFATSHSWQGFFILGWGLIVIGLSDNIIRFLLAKKMADVHPIVTVLGVIMGLKYFGITGLIFGPLMISYFIILLKIYYIEYQKPLIERRKEKDKQRTILPSYFNVPFLGNKPKQK